MSKDKAKHPQNNPTSDPHKKGGEKETTNRHVYVEPGAKIDFVEDLRQEYKANQSDSTTHNKQQLFGTKIGAGLVFVYVALTLWMARSAQKTAETAVIDQRPYMVVKLPGNIVPKLAANVALHADVTIVNIGRTPALDHYQVVKLAYFPQPKPGHPNEYIVESEKNFADGEFAKLATEEHQARSVLRPLKAEQDLAPNADFNAGDVEGLTLSQGQFDDITSIAKGNHWAGAVFLIGLITYTDRTNQPYSTEFCWFALDPEATHWERCRWRNTIR
jgi:hypothetical protein